MDLIRCTVLNSIVNEMMAEQCLYISILFKLSFKVPIPKGNLTDYFPCHKFDSHGCGCHDNFSMQVHSRVANYVSQQTPKEYYIFIVYINLLMQGRK